MSGAALQAVMVRGCCYVYYALDIGFSVDLKRGVGLIQQASADGGFHHDARAPSSFELRPAPIHLRQTIEPIQGTTLRTDERVTLTLYDFGAVSVRYRVPFEGTLAELAAMSVELYDNKRFAADARARAESLLAAIRPAVRRPGVREVVEDYVVFVVPALPDGLGDLERFLADNSPLLAQILSSNTSPLAAPQQRHELANRISYYPDDATLMTWNAAMIVGQDLEDALILLELANVQLCELRYLDNQLDASLQESYEATTRMADVRAQMRRIRELMLDGQAFSEAVTNAFKPFPDVYLARLYGLASAALGLNHFDQSIKSKLGLLNTLYTTLLDEATHAHSVRLEWIIIILILIEILMGLSEKLLPLLWP